MLPKILVQFNLVQFSSNNSKSIRQFEEMTFLKSFNSEN